MSRCELSGKGPVVKNLVSHSNIKTKSRAFPNVQNKHFFSQANKVYFKFKVACSTIREIDKHQSFDAFLLVQPDKNLSKKALHLKKSLLKRTRKKPIIRKKAVGDKNET